MTRAKKSYLELQRQHLTDELRQREADARKAAASEWETEYDLQAIDRSLTKAPTTQP